MMPGVWPFERRVGGLRFWREQDFTPCVPPQFAPDLKDIDQTDLAAMSREELEDLAWRLHELARALANRAGEELQDQFAPAVERRPLST